MTRLKSNARSRVVSRRAILAGKALSGDQTIEFTGGIYQVPVEAEQKHAANLTSTAAQSVRKTGSDGLAARRLALLSKLTGQQ